MVLAHLERAAPARGHVALGQGVRRVAVVDDHRLFADLLVDLLRLREGVEPVGAAYDVTAGIRLAVSTEPDVVVLDHCFANDPQDGLVAARAVAERLPWTAVVLVSGLMTPELVRRAGAAGVAAVMPKDVPVDELVDLVRTVRPGSLTVHRSLLSALGGGWPPPPEDDLTRREHEVLSCLMLGMDARETAEHLGVSLNTCRGYIKVLLRKLDAHSQLQAVAEARRRGYGALDVPDLG